ncbi:MULTISPECIES: allophanate hydrolase [Acinetobacter]|uniref:Allophanate hydrolase n=1 Tax=Acinetobacter haemolyticus TaxID=29430 RepID=A0A372MN67_ACIHA|nr:MULTISPECIES: allophanate hydrolase [Acinetobacter]EEH67391.1 allophanate hydrolase [Acinetobacter sp. ATCC 27244]ENW19845.1 allophanate hydrolase [Acinetobacter haemolyticus NIPH 261]NAR51319.1 allophanate hydrolase [Acinetobacter haemolyticus]NAR55363.1 allophanate hydrolase [Acinetobacter haemolyticus]NAR56364.1 allophanate hydrolase [Acinetobacter haemolyticus]
MHEIKTLGWTISEWQIAYSKNEIQLDTLKDLVASIDPQDNAWISIATVEQIEQQIQVLNELTKEAESLAKQFPLYGVPFAVKDNIDVAGFVTTAACKALTTVAAQDAETVRLLKQAGAIVVGKTNLDQFATGLVGTRSPFGAVTNSFKPEYVSGGSSSGSASVVARGFVPFALGTDTAGSGRVPAAFNNIVGLKPTKGRFSNRGLLPACKSLDCISIFALIVADADLVANVLEAYDPLDSYSRKHPKNVPAHFSSKLKFAIPEKLNFFGDEQAEKAFQQTIQLLESLNAEITKIDFSDFEQLAAQLYQGSWVAERTAAVEDLLKANSDAFDPTVLEIIKNGEKYSAVDAYNAEYLKQDLTRKIQQKLADFDALIVPTAPTIYTIEQLQQNPIEYNAHLGTYTNFTNLADLSALALPAGFRADHLPFGITLIATAWHDAALVHFGKAWQNYLALKLGALDKTLPLSSATPISQHHIRVAVVGAHLTGMPLNFQLTTRDAVHIETTKTSKNYALYALNGTVPPKPGLARQQDGQSIIVELWDVPTARFGEFVAEIPTPLGMGNVELEDGRWVKGFICEPYGIDDAENISHFGGWRAYIQHRNSQTANTAN